MSRIRSIKIRNQVAERAHGCCEYCMAQALYSHDYFSVDHIISILLGGSDLLENLAHICQTCNNHKYIFIEALDPVTGLLAPLFNPRLSKWTEHFKWDETFTIVIGHTPTGRATVEKLHLNREGLINLREVLYSVKNTRLSI
ncbi:MAG TPA: HNH endonuclease [Bacteroidetes bacterium]|nr:HNH endonuclease [Bacteroidota bacterium]